MKKHNFLTLSFILLILFACKKKDDETNNDPAPNDNNIDQNDDLTILPNGSQTFTGNLSNGEIVSDLSWAWNSSMACFVETVKDQYKGNHVFYQVDLPVNSTMDIYLTPNSSSSQIALYGFSKGANSTDIPPNVTSSVSCEADPSNSNGATTGNRHIYFNAINNPYSVIIGVAGAEGVLSGGFEIEIVIES